MSIETQIRAVLTEYFGGGQWMDGRTGHRFTPAAMKLAALFHASVDTRPEGGDPAETGAPFTSGAVGEAETPNPSHRSTGE